MKCFPQKYDQESTDLSPKKSHDAIRYVMGLTNVIAIQSNEHN